MSREFVVALEALATASDGVTPQLLAAASSMGQVAILMFPPDRAVDLFQEMQMLTNAHASPATLKCLAATILHLCATDPKFGNSERQYDVARCLTGMVLSSDRSCQNLGSNLLCKLDSSTPATARLCSQLLVRLAIQLGSIPSQGIRDLAGESCPADEAATLETSGVVAICVALLMEHPEVTLNNSLSLGEFVFDVLLQIIFVPDCIRSQPLLGPLLSLVINLVDADAKRTYHAMHVLLPVALNDVALLECLLGIMCLVPAVVEIFLSENCDALLKCIRAAYAKGGWGEGVQKKAGLSHHIFLAIFPPRKPKENWLLCCRSHTAAVHRQSKRCSAIAPCGWFGKKVRAFRCVGPVSFFCAI